MGPRWKGRGAEAKALAEPISSTISKLQSSLIESEASGLITGCNVLLAVEPYQSELLDRACFGRPIITADKNKQWFQLSSEEAFYLFQALNCIKILDKDGCSKNVLDTWRYMKSQNANFPVSYKAYSHLRSKNWLVRSGLQYGVDFVAYRHHPSLVHSEFAVLVKPEGDCGFNQRLAVWSDVHCAVRLGGSVAKTLLALCVDKNGCSIEDSPECLKNYTVDELVVTRWIPAQSREDRSAGLDENV